jgi:ABC-type nitrate/sulfonate/bicarbonate transport system substrate-binding protein
VASAARLSRRSLLSLVPGGIAALALAACGDSGSDKAASPSEASLPPIKKMTFMAGFKPQANLPFVGAYVARDKGFFQEQRLDVDIRHAQNGEHLQLLLAGEVAVTTANGANVLQRNAESLPLVALALIGQKSEQGFIVGANSSISSIKDWPGRTFGYKGTVPTEFLAVAKAGGIDPAKVKQVSVGFDPRILSEGQVDILAVFVSNEPDTLDRIGFKTRLFDPSEYGVPALGLTYVSTRDQLDKDPDRLERFLRAVLHGIEFADANRNEALDIVMKYAPMEDRNHQLFMMNTELERAKTDQTKASGLGWQTAAQWKALQDSLQEFGAITKPVDYSNAFTDRFLKNIYRGGTLIWPS